MRTRGARVAAMGLAVLAWQAWGGPLPAQAQVPPTVSLTLVPGPVSGWVLSSEGANTRAGGSIEVTATVAYSLKVRADRARMTEYAAGAYLTPSPRTLGAPLTIQTAKTSGTGIPVASVAVGTSDATIATGVVGTDRYALTLSQPTTLADPALPPGRTYRLVLTYTASAAL